MITLGVMLGWTSDFLDSRVGGTYAGDIAIQVIEDLESYGVKFEDREEAFRVVFVSLHDDVTRQRVGVFFYFIAVCGLAPIVFGLFPSRKS